MLACHKNVLQLPCFSIPPLLRRKVAKTSVACGETVSHGQVCYPALPPPVVVGICSWHYILFQSAGVPNPGKWPAKGSGVVPRFNSKTNSVRNAPSTVADKGSDSYSDPNMQLISEMIEHISRSPSTIEAREVLLQHYNACAVFRC